MEGGEKMSEYNGYIYLSRVTEAKLLAMEVMKQKDLNSMSPEEIADQYVHLQKAIEAEIAENRKN